mgnify:CR=1 FL=1
MRKFTLFFSLAVMFFATAVQAQEAITIQEFLDRADEQTEYQLTGVVTSIVNTQYGNLYIEDETGSIYIYGLLTPEGEAKQFESLDVDVNDTLTVRGTYTLYNNIVEIKNATYVDNKKFPGTDPVEYATELINGGFEKWSAGKPEGWTSVASNATITPSADAFEGESAVAVAGIKSSNKRFTSEILRLQPNTGDEHYLFTVYAKAGSAVFSKIRPGYVTITDGKADTYTYADAAVEVTAEWTKYEYTFQLTEQTDVALIIMNARNDKGENMLLIDNASLKISKASTY